MENRRKYSLAVLLLFALWATYYGWANQMLNVKSGAAPQDIVPRLVATTIVLALALAGTFLIKRYVWVSTVIAILAAGYLALMGFGSYLVG